MQYITLINVDVLLQNAELSCAQSTLRLIVFAHLWALNCTAFKRHSTVGYFDLIVLYLTSWVEDSLFCSHSNRS